MTDQAGYTPSAVLLSEAMRICGRAELLKNGAPPYLKHNPAFKASTELLADAADLLTQAMNTMAVIESALNNLLILHEPEYEAMKQAAANQPRASQ